MTSHRLLRRRSLLGAGAALPLVALAACTTSPAEQSEAPPVDPLAAVLDAHVALRAAYDAAIAAFADQAARLQPLREHVDEHISALAAAQAVAPPSGTSSPAGSSRSAGATGSSASAAAPATTAPADVETTIAGLVNQENAIIATLAPLVASQPAERAPLLGSISAAHSCHLAVLA